MSLLNDPLVIHAINLEATCTFFGQVDFSPIVGVEYAKAESPLGSSGKGFLF